MKPSSYITLDEKITKESKEYYRQLSDLGLYLEHEPEITKEVVKEDAQETEVVTETETTKEVTEEVLEETSAEEVTAEVSGNKVEKFTVEELMKNTHAQLVEMATTYGLEGLEGLSKKEISLKIIEVANVG